MKPGYMIGSATAGALVTDKPPVKGAHGYLPSYPEMRSSFFAMGGQIARGRNLGIVDIVRLRLRWLAYWALVFPTPNGRD